MVCSQYSTTNPFAFSFSHSHKTLSFSLNILYPIFSDFILIGLPIVDPTFIHKDACSIVRKLLFAPLAEHRLGFQMLQENSYWKETSPLTIPSYSRNTSWLCRVFQFVQHFQESTEDHMDWNSLNMRNIGAKIAGSDLRSAFGNHLNQPVGESGSSRALVFIGQINGQQRGCRACKFTYGSNQGLAGGLGEGQDP